MKQKFTVHSTDILEDPHEFIMKILYPGCVAQGGHDYCHESESIDDLAQILGERFADAIKHHITTGDNT